MANGEIGIWFSTHEEIHKFTEAIGDLNNFPLIAIHVEKFADGRIFSIGSQLRNKYNFKNELRAFGDVLRDQIFFLKRSGFNSYLIRKDRDAKDAIKGLDDFSDPYQGASDILEPVWNVANDNFKIKEKINKMNKDIHIFNEELREKNPSEIIKWALREK